MELHEELAARTNAIERNRENRARLAQVNSKYTTTGQGTIEFGRRVDFGLTYVEEPWMSYGAAVDVDDLANKLDLPDNDVPLPLSSGFVTEWDRDENDFYVGAWVAVRVYFPPKTGWLPKVEGEWPLELTGEVPVDVEFDMTHYFTFSGIAMKDVPLEGAGD